ncbi:hypothetical protein DPMN_023789 [Dreissena polymorpha]|uniref:Uncharacterized protein n=1 Tax=Dreissena polymorpha TaxID=45954 RepID=A0A9D4RA77_DREPO|nr:hypothetical protein DPMN_023789 [Dreissena polymorpha]
MRNKAAHSLYGCATNARRSRCCQRNCKDRRGLEGVDKSGHGIGYTKEDDHIKAAKFDVYTLKQW